MVRDRRRLALVPATAVDEERLRGIRHFEPMQVQTHFSRTSKLNRWYRGIVGRVAEGIDASPDALHCELKFKAGLVQQIIMVKSPKVGGAIAVRLKSTAYPEMDETEFSNYVDLAIEIMCRDYLGNISSRRMQQHILDWVGHRPRLDPRPKCA